MPAVILQAIAEAVVLVALVFSFMAVIVLIGVSQ